MPPHDGNSLPPSALHGERADMTSPALKTRCALAADGCVSTAGWLPVIVATRPTRRGVLGCPLVMSRRGQSAGRFAKAARVRGAVGEGLVVARSLPAVGHQALDRPHLDPHRADLTGEKVGRTRRSPGATCSAFLPPHQRVRLRGRARRAGSRSRIRSWIRSAPPQVRTMPPCVPRSPRSRAPTDHRPGR
jgi:hypothetical protein